MRYKKELDSVLAKIVALWGIPGLSVGMVAGGEIMHACNIGVQSLETGTPVASSSIFCLASISKCFVASAVMQLVERGWVDLDAPLVRFLPYFKLDDERYPQITIRQVLSHTSGLPDIDEFEYRDLLSRPDDDDGAAERFARSLSGRRLVHAPGEKFLYSNLGYDVLGDLIAKVSGGTFEAYLRQNILLPAGMADSSYLPADLAPGRQAVPHLRMPGMAVNRAPAYARADGPASFLYSTADDMCRWAITCLDRGRRPVGRILTPASYARMWSPAARRDSPPLREEMGLGWNLGHFEGQRTISHGGAGLGWSSLLVLLPDLDRGAVILFNAEDAAIHLISRAVLRALLDLEPQAGSVSFMVPLSQAMQQGGIGAARARYAELKESGGNEFFFNEYQLIDLGLNMLNAGKVGESIATLELNIDLFPQSLDSYIFLAKLHLRKGECSLATKILRRALEREPGNPEATDLLAQVEGCP
ncbi:MAG: serine hydrolase [Anaerolineales bacterium]|nr:serine hydrolase [Anaerolineales bacterium]